MMLKKIVLSLFVLMVLAANAEAQNYCGHHDVGCQSSSYSSCWQTAQNYCTGCKAVCQQQGTIGYEPDCISRCQNEYDQEQASCWEAYCFYWFAWSPGMGTPTRLFCGAA